MTYENNWRCRNKKSKYVIKVNNKDKEYFPEDVSSMILQ